MTSETVPPPEAPPVRIAVCGGPQSGKTTFARTLGLQVYSTDVAFADREWSQVSSDVSEWFNRDGSWVIEGVVVPRALRKWLSSHSRGKPCDKVVWLNTSYAPLSEDQARMGKGCLTVLREIQRSLQKRGVFVEGVPRG